MIFAIFKVCEVFTNLIRKVSGWVVLEIEPCMLEIHSQIFTTKIYIDIRDGCININPTIRNISSNANYDYP